MTSRIAEVEASAKRKRRCQSRSVCSAGLGGTGRADCAPACAGEAGRKLIEGRTASLRPGRKLTSPSPWFSLAHLVLPAAGPRAACPDKREPVQPGRLSTERRACLDGVRGSLANIFVNLAFCGQKYFPPNGKGKRRRKKKQTSFEIFSIPSCLFTGQIASISPVLVYSVADSSAVGAGLQGWLHPINAEFAGFIAVFCDLNRHLF